jgi:hypothetical protein
MLKRDEKLRSCVVKYDGRKHKVTLKNVKFVPDLWISLLLIYKVMIGNEGLLIKLANGETKLVFNQLVNTKRGFVSGIKMVPILNQVANTVVETKK